MLSKGNPILITGMHRSGTSLTAAILKDLGVYLGTDKELMSPAPDNPDGFYERWDVMRLNDALLKRAGASWHEPPVARHFWRQGLEEAQRQFIDHAVRILDRLQGKEPWAIKDPRFSLTLGFWQTLIPNARYLIGIRHPLEVAASLANRQGFDEAYSLALWQQYYQWLEATTRPEQRLVIAYQDLLSKSSDSIMRLIDWLGLQADQSQRIQALGRIRPELHHHESPDKDKAWLTGYWQNDPFYAGILNTWHQWLQEARQGLDVGYPVIERGQSITEIHDLSGQGKESQEKAVSISSGFQKKSIPFQNITDFMESVRALNTFVRDNRLLRYQASILRHACFSLVPPFDGDSIKNNDSLFLPGKRIAYHFAGLMPFWIITGDLQLGYPLAWFYCPDNQVLIRLSRGSTGHPASIDPIEHWSCQIEKALQEREPYKPDTRDLKPVIVTGHRNFAHHLWNELSALAEWLEHTQADERTGVTLIPLREPFGPLEGIFPELQSLTLLRSVTTPQDINRMSGCLVMPGSRKVTRRVREIVANYLQNQASEVARRMEQDFLNRHQPVFWFSVRDHDRTCLNQMEFLEALALRLLNSYPDSAILLDGFAFTPYEPDLDTLIAAEKRAGSLRDFIQELKNRVTVSHGPDTAARLCSVSGLSLIDNLYLARHVNYYVCHAGTLQHKLGWLYDIPGIMHTVLDDKTGYSPERWYAAQVEDGIAPKVLPREYITVAGEHNTDIPSRNRNYLINKVSGAIDHILDDVQNTLLVSKTGDTVVNTARKKCLLYGSWQLGRLQAYLNAYPAFREQYDIIPLPPAFRMTSDDLQRLAEILPQTGLFIAQWIPDDYRPNPELATRNWMNRLPPEARSIRLPILGFTGYHPELFTFKRRGQSDIQDTWEFHDYHILKSWHEGLSVSDVCNKLKLGELGRTHAWQDAWRQALEKLRQDEVGLDTGVADHLEAEGKNTLLFTMPNNPAAPLLEYLAQRILEKIIGYVPDKPGFPCVSNITHYPLNPQAHLQLGCRFANSPDQYRIKGQDKTLKQIVTDYFAFYDQCNDAEWNYQQRVREETVRAAFTSRPEPSSAVQARYDYRRIHTAQQLVFMSPARLDERTPPHPRLTLKSGLWPDTGVATIPGGKAILEFPCQYFDASGLEIMEVFDPVAKRIERGRKPEDHQVLKGRICPVIVPGAGIFAHWLGDLLPALHLLELAGIHFDSIDHFILNRNDLAYHAESFNKLGIKPERVIPWSKSLRYIQADELIVPTKARNHLCTAPWIIEWLRQTFVPDWKQKAAAPLSGLRLYLSRNQASKRRVINETRVLEVLQPYDFTTIYLENLSVSEAANLLVQAEAVVAPHGAGLANMVFCRPGTLLVEWYGWHISQEYWITAQTMGLDYYNLACPGPDGRYYDEIELDYGKRFAEINSADIEVDCETLARFLETRYRG